MALKNNISGSVQFDYDEVKIAFIDTVNNVLAGKLDDYWTRYEVNEVMDRVHQLRRLLKQNGSGDPIRIDGNEVDIAYDNGTEILMFKNSEIQILPCEDGFDIFVDLHLRLSHAGFEEMYKILQKYYYFTQSFLDCFLKSCNVCRSTNMAVSNIKTSIDPMNENIPCMLLNYLVHIAFLDMNSLYPYLHNEFKYILIYKEIASGYILLRPLLALDEHEIALELYKIFIDFGQPYTIQTTDLVFFQDVVSLLQQTPLYNCMVSVKQLDDTKIKSTIAERIDKWMTKSKSTNWEIGCYIVQMSLNSEGKPKAIEKLFGKKVTQKKKSPSHMEQTKTEKTTATVATETTVNRQIDLHTEVDKAVLTDNIKSEQDWDEKGSADQEFYVIETVEDDN